MLHAYDEHDEDRDQNEDADLDYNSEEEEGDESDDEDDEQGKKSEDDNGSDDDEDKPITRRELKELLKSNQNKNNAQRRVSQKPRDKQAPIPNSRLDKIEQSQQRIELLERKRSFGHENNLSPAEVDVVFRLTKRPTRKFLEEPYVKGALEAIRAQQNVRQNTPGGSGKPFRSESGKTWGELSPEEKENNFADRRRAILESKKR